MLARLLSSMLQMLTTRCYRRWTSHSKEDGDTQQAVMRALSTLSNLDTIVFSVAQCKTPLSLHLLPSMREISLIGTCETPAHHDETLDNLAKLVAQSPGISSISIASNWRSSQPIGETQSLHQVFKYCTGARGVSLVPLRHLSVNVGLVRLDCVTLPHLQYLTSLELTNIEDPYTRQWYVVEEEHGETALREEQKRHGQSVEDIWKSVKEAGVLLEALVVDVVGPALLHYIGSYVGLRKLVVKPGGFTDGTRSDALAVEFFAVALVKHVRSLRELEIQAHYEGEWCFSPSNVSVIAACRNLEMLRMSVISDQLSATLSRKTALSNVDAIVSYPLSL